VTFVLSRRRVQLDDYLPSARRFAKLAGSPAAMIFCCAASTA
jgi:hypothetical protein